MSERKYLNVFVYGEKGKLTNLLSELGETVEGNWESIQMPATRKQIGEDAYEFRLTVNNTTGFLRFFSSYSSPYLLFLRDSGIKGADRPISVTDNDYLVKDFCKQFLKPVCTKLDLKLHVTRATPY
ncbi:MAG: hypothetical protein K8F91_02695 [Candidatus Obscuribacterales bacterium]|nr:hypothetical protein [Candidatus Obscuribacterales bacterium]